MASIDEVAVQISSAGVPVLFLDTCILLDIIRSTNRCLRDHAARGSELLRLASATPPACLVVVSSIVPYEWKANVQKVSDEVVRHLAKTEEQSSHFHDACQALGIATPFGRAGYAQMGLAERLRDLSMQILDKAIIIDADEGSRSRAVTRVVNKTPPAQKSSEVKDCAILEEYLAVCQRLQAAGFAGKRVFCTSNTEDYCAATGKPHPSLESELMACDLIFTANLPWAVHEITH
jgi:PIN domain